MKQVVTIIILFYQISLATGQAWLVPWQGRQAITLINYNLQDLHDHQVRLELGYQDCMDSLFVDVRFTDDSGVNTLPHWIQYVERGERAVIYVKVEHLLPYSSTKIYWYFDNAAAEDASDPSATLIFYDDLATDNGWSGIESGSVAIGDINGISVLVKDEDCTNAGAWVSLGDTISNFKLLIKDFRMAEGLDDCPINEYGVETALYRGLNFLRDAYNTDNGGIAGLQTRSGSTVYGAMTEQVNQPSGRWYHTEVSYCHICLFNTNAQIWSDSMRLMENLYSSNYEMYDFDRVTVRGGGPYYIDYIAVASKACIEPVVTFGSLESCAVAELVDYAADFCEENKGKITLAVVSGTAPYEVSWYRGLDSVGTMYVPTTDTISIDNLAAGQYTIHIKDAKGCEN